MCLGSARLSRAGDGVLAIADFLCNSSFRAADVSYESLFRRDAETNTRDACATPEVQRERVFNKGTAFVI
jgi:hypothetical protein